MKIAKEGRGFILSGFAVGIAGGFAHSFIGAAACVLGTLGIVFGCFCAYFFRDPDRPLPTDAGKIYSPGDGTVLTVEKEGAGDIQTVRIFLSILDVHVQRFPCSGKVTRVRYTRGSFKAAMVADARKNERNSVAVAVDGRKEEVVFDQLTGFVARRIRCWTKEGDTAVAGERYGLIQFGSQAALHLPASVKILVQPGDKCVGGITEIGQWTAQG